jgi:hypothetical protein
VQFIFLEGAKRSGNHLFVEWLASQAGEIAHCNNYFYKIDEDLDNPDHDLIEPPFDEMLQYGIDHIRTSASTIGLISFEHPGRLSRDEIRRLFDAAHTGLAPRLSVNLHILRDPFNWMASYSRLKASVNLRGISYGVDATFEETRENYARHHHEYWLRWYRSWSLWSRLWECDRVNYNCFVRFIDYRRAIAERLSLIWNDSMDEKVIATLSSQGSSFGASIVTPERDLTQAVTERFHFALPLFLEFGIPQPIWRAGAITFPDVALAVRGVVEQRINGGIAGILYPVQWPAT